MVSRVKMAALEAEIVTARTEVEGADAAVKAARAVYDRSIARLTAAKTAHREYQLTTDHNVDEDADPESDEAAAD